MSRDPAYLPADGIGQYPGRPSRALPGRRHPCGEPQLTLDQLRPAGTKGPRIANQRLRRLPRLHRSPRPAVTWPQRLPAAPGIGGGFIMRRLVTDR